MSGRHGLIAGVVGILLMGSGCVSCGANGYGLAHEAGPECDTLTCQRNQVYVFAVSGINPVEMIALDTFREQLNRKGYAKVATGQTVHAIWMAAEIKRIQADEPGAAIVVIGVEGGANTAVKLAEKATARGAAVSGVVLFERKAANRPIMDGPRFLTVADHPVSSDESVALVAQLLDGVAQTTVQPFIVAMPSWDYPHAPEPRPTLDPNQSPDWAFLFDGGTPGRVGSSMVPAIASATRLQPSTTAAQR